MKHLAKILATTLWMAFSTAMLAGENFVILEDSTGDVPKVVAGQVGLSVREATPASTFKIVLAWAALEEKLATPSTTFRSSDKYIPGTPRLLAMQEALHLSSNDYFISLGNRLGRKRILDYAVKSGLVSATDSPDWLPENLAGVQHAGDLKVTPVQIHQLVSRIARGQLASRPEVQKDLLAVLSWPSSKPEILIYAKTGTWNGAVWCTGFGGPEDDLKAVTVFSTYSQQNWQPAREMVIEKFYKRFGQEAPKE